LNKRRTWLDVGALPPSRRRLAGPNVGTSTSESAPVSNLSNQTMKQMLNWTRRILIATLALIVAVIGVGAGYQFAATRSTERRFPAPGTLVDVGGHKLHLHCQGAGSPAVVLDAGLSGASYDWEGVAKEIALFTRVCTYDRAGYGWSDPGPRPRTSQQCVAELQALVNNAPIQKPFILVAHSWAGLNARLYASEHPEEIAGLILVDSLNTDRLPEAAPEGFVSTLFKFLNATACLGTVRLAIPRIMGDQRPDREAVKFRQDMLSRTKSAHAIYDELTGQQNWLTVRAGFKHLRDKPVIVISRRFEENQTNQDAAEFSREWTKDQQALLGISRNSKLLVAKTLEHNIQFSEPGLIVEAVRGMVQSRANTSVPSR
jgi:pimeloyl-ACP methyl ester carboxylesterase